MEPTAEKKSHRVQVLEAIHALHDLGIKAINTESIVRTTGLQRLQVADAIKELKVREDIAASERGYYEPIFRHPPSEAISVTVMPMGGVKLEKGDMVMELTPHEWTYELAPLAAGASAQAAVMEHVQRTIVLAASVESLKKTVQALKEKIRGQSNGHQATLDV